MTNRNKDARLRHSKVTRHRWQQSKTTRGTKAKPSGDKKLSKQKQEMKTKAKNGKELTQEELKL